MSELHKTFKDIINSFTDVQKLARNAELSAFCGFRETKTDKPEVRPEQNDLWKYGNEYCFCFSDPKGELRLMFGDGATVPVRDYMVDGKEGYTLIWRDYAKS